ncbi:MAG: hypothetical protein GXY09_04850 [Bacteroidales bacterium]|nr:hypothetical protein [Bacteroidales bacterium]
MNYQRLLSHFLFIIQLSAFAVTANAQTVYAYNSFKIRVSEASVIKITPSTPITVYMNATVAGGDLSNSPNSDSYLKLTSIVDQGGKRKVEAAITTGKAPDGTLLKLYASPCTTGSGTFGSVDPEITLQPNVNKRIIYNIRSCYTGNGPTDGYNLTYTWMLDPNNLSKLKAFTTNAAFVTFTISSHW